MADDWLSVCLGKKTAWNIPDPVMEELITLKNAAGAALETAKNETTRTHVFYSVEFCQRQNSHAIRRGRIAAQCKEAFDALTAAMRDMKRRYFLTPPPADSDYISLGLKPRDTTQTASGTPAAQVTIETYLVGRHELGVKIIYVTGSPADPANKCYRIWYSVVAPPGMAATVDSVEFSRSGNSQAENLPRTADFQQPPANPGDLRKSFFTKRKKDVIEFEFGDSGKNCFMAVQIENEGKKGPWGPLTSALIP
jgi:hypothetical protein